MEINELYLKTAFCCMACDGDIAPKELEFIRSYVSNNELFSVVDVENKLNEYVADINQQGISFLNDYLKDIANMSLTETQELNIVRIAIQMIEVDIRKTKDGQRIRRPCTWNRTSDQERSSGTGRIYNSGVHG